MKTINALISASNVSVIKHHKSILKNIDIQINKNDKLLIPKGNPITVSLNKPAINTNI